jgi:glycosyltransferase involved in cell wall biosynthesis
MRILFNAAAESVHTIRWANAMADRGHTVGLHTFGEPVCVLDPRVALFRNPVPQPLGFLFGGPFFRRTLTRFKPDLVHSMHSGNYGTLTRGVRDVSVVLSIWGGDIHVWPNRDRLHRWLTLTNLRQHTVITSTSRVMVQDLKHLLADPALEVPVVPYGVESERFRPADRPSDPDVIRIGTVKSFIPDSGIDTLIRAFAQLSQDEELKHMGLELEIAGSGPLDVAYRRLADELRVTGQVRFLGQLDHADVPDFMRRLSIYAALSRRESFGVAIVEASMSGVPIVASNLQGIPEVVQHDRTGLLVEPNDVQAAADALRYVVMNPARGREMGREGRLQMKRLYEWSDCVAMMEAVYTAATNQWKAGKS